MTPNNPQLSNCCKAPLKEFPNARRGQTIPMQCSKCDKDCGLDVQEPIQKPAWLEGHACRFNDGEQTCDCFVEGYERGREEAVREAVDKINSFLPEGVRVSYNQELHLFGVHLSPTSEK